MTRAPLTQDAAALSRRVSLQRTLCFCYCLAASESVLVMVGTRSSEVLTLDAWTPKQPQDGVHASTLIHAILRARFQTRLVPLRVATKASCLKQMASLRQMTSTKTCCQNQTQTVLDRICATWCLKARCDSVTIVPCLSSLNCAGQALFLWLCYCQLHMLHTIRGVLLMRSMWEIRSSGCVSSAGAVARCRKLTICYLCGELYQDS